MLGQVLGVSAEKLTAETIAQLVADSREEDQVLDFKLVMPDPADKKSRRNFFANVSAFANANGGLLVYGVREDPKTDRAAELCPVPEADRTRLTRMLDTAVWPRVRDVRWHPLPVGDDTYYYVLEVPPSSMAPHAVWDKPNLTYWRRSGKDRHELNEAEVAREYRWRFDAEREAVRLGDKLVSLARRRLAGDRGCLWLTAVPLNRHTRIMRPLAAALPLLKQNIMPDPFLAFANVGFLGPEVRVGHRCLEFAEAWDTPGARHKWATLGDRGQFLSQLSATVRRIEVHDGQHEGPWLNATELIRGVLLALLAYSRLAARFHLSGEATVRAGIMLAPGKHVYHLPPGRFPTPLPCREDVDAAGTEADVSDIADMMRAAKDVLDDLASAFGMGEFVHLSRQGQLVLSAFYPQDRKSWSDWANAEGVPFIEEA